MAQRIIELDDLPAPVARGLEVVAELARVLAGQSSSQGKGEKPTKLSTRKGVVYGSLRREELMTSTSPTKPLTMLDTNVLVDALYEDF